MTGIQRRIEDALIRRSLCELRLTKKILFLCFVILAFASNYATPCFGAEVLTSAFKMNPYDLSAPETSKLRFPPDVGVGVYWGDGRFNITLNNFYDEETKKCLLQKSTCFRQEGDFVFASGKEGWLVLNLAARTYQVSPNAGDFTPTEQLVLKKLAKRTKGNVYFNPDTLMPKL